MRFEKWQALGNDYLIIESGELPAAMSPERTRLICDQHFGLGGDGIVLVSPPREAGSVASLRIFNPDGSEAELSGNGVREAVLFLRRHGRTPEGAFAVETPAGRIEAEVLGDDRCSVLMGAATTQSRDYPGGSSDGLGVAEAGGRKWNFRHVSIGNPQCAIEVGPEVEELDLALLGPELEGSDLFPSRTNVSFYEVSGDRVRARIFERGVGETLSSGTGAIGAAVAAHLGGAPSALTVKLDGGELEVGIGPKLEITLTGWAEPVFAGEASAEFRSRITKAPG